MSKVSYLIALGLSTGLAGPLAQALEFNAAAELGARLNTNALRSSSSEKTDIVYTPAISADASHEGQNYDLGAAYTVAHRIFQRDFFDDSTVVTGYGNLNWRVLPERLDLRVTQSRNESTRESFNRGTQDDRQVISRTEAAPTLRFRVRGADELQFQYTFTDTVSGDNDIDNQRHAATARYVYGMSAASTLALAGTRGKTEYDFTGVPDVDFTTYTATLDNTNTRGRLLATVGHSLFERDGLDDAKGLIWDVNWTNEFGAGSTFSISAARQISDRSQELLDVDSRAFEDLIFGNSDLTDLFQQTSADITLGHTIGPTELQLSFGWSESNYEVAPRDEDAFRLEAGATRLIRRGIQGRVRLFFSDRKYNQLDFGYQDYRIETSALWDVNPRFEAEVGVFAERRKGDNSSGDFDDLGVFAVARYFFTGQNTVGSFR